MFLVVVGDINFCIIIRIIFWGCISVSINVYISEGYGLEIFGVVEEGECRFNFRCYW